jgi:hypothetical protein
MEVIINSLAHINEAIVYSFCGQIEMAKAVLKLPWILGYIIIYFFTIWDSYRSALEHNKLRQLAELENEPIQAVFLNTWEFQYLEQKNPVTAAVYSFLFPGLGQLYNHQLGIGFWAILWWWIHLTLSRAHESLLYMLLGNFPEATAVLKPQWLLYMPSIIGGSVYYAYITALEHNRLYRREQRQFLAERYPNSGDIIRFGDGIS